MPFEFERSEIPEIIIIQPKVFRDARGLFIETYKYSDFSAAGIGGYFVQDNYSRSEKGVLRGLHYQKDPGAQGKLVRCVSGKVFDAAVDIRKGSPTFGKWVGVELSEENGLMIYVPPGFAHGFLALSESAEVLYKCTGEYASSLDRGIIWNDSDIGIRWPLGAPVLSEKDGRHPGLRDADNNFEYAV